MLKNEELNRANRKLPLKGAHCLLGLVRGGTNVGTTTLLLRS